MSKWCGDENCLQCADKEPDLYVHLPRADYEALREQNRVLREAAKQAMNLIHEDIVQGDKAGRRLKAETILWNALTATSQERSVNKEG